jgi:hypothetical protein
VSRGAATLLFLLATGALGCGKYGPPLRAGAEKPPEKKPSFEVPLPSAPPEAAPEPAPEATPALEEEPPLEGAP